MGLPLKSQKGYKPGKADFKAQQFAQKADSGMPKKYKTKSYPDEWQVNLDYTIKDIEVSKSFGEMLEDLVSSTAEINAGVVHDSILKAATNAMQQKHDYNEYPEPDINELAKGLTAEEIEELEFLTNKKVSHAVKSGKYPKDGYGAKGLVSDEILQLHVGDSYLFITTKFPGSPAAIISYATKHGLLDGAYSLNPASNCAEKTVKTNQVFYIKKLGADNNGDWGILNEGDLFPEPPPVTLLLKKHTKKPAPAVNMSSEQPNLQTIPKGKFKFQFYSSDALKGLQQGTTYGVGEDKKTFLCYEGDTAIFAKGFLSKQGIEKAMTQLKYEAVYGKGLQAEFGNQLPSGVGPFCDNPQCEYHEWKAEAGQPYLHLNNISGPKKAIKRYINHQGKHCCESCAEIAVMLGHAMASLEENW